MKRIVSIALSLLTLAQVLVGGVAAQNAQTGTARDMYTKYNNGAGSQQGRPGVKVSIRLKRDGKERWASADEKFYSGDWIKLVLDTNFAGYVAVINTGTTGKQTLLYPQADDAVFPADGAVLPPAQDKWIVFDNNAGEEKVALIFSNKPMKLHAQHASAPGGSASAQQQSEHASVGGMANNQEAQSALAELNSRALNRGRDRSASRDMFTETIGTETYSVASQAALSEPIGFAFTLRHGKR